MLAVVVAWWREIVIVLLFGTSAYLLESKETLKHEITQIELSYQLAVKTAEAKAATALQQKAEIEAEGVKEYVKKVEALHDQYASVVAAGNSVQSKTAEYNARLHTVAREAAENYGKTAALLYGECRAEYTEMGRYVNTVDAELDVVTQPQKSPD